MQLYIQVCTDLGAGFISSSFTLSHDANERNTLWTFCQCMPISVFSSCKAVIQFQKTLNIAHVVILAEFKGIVHPKIKILLSFTHPQVIPNLHECLCFEHKGRYFEESL